MVHPLDPETGKAIYSEVIPCRCQVERIKAERKAKLLRYCYLPEGSWDKTFETFRADSQKLKTALKAARAVADPESRVRWLTLISKVDRGKSHLAVAICREWLKRDMPARYVFVPDLLDELRAGYDHQGEESFQARMQFYKVVPLLVLDDLGTEKTSEWVTEKLTTIINDRAESGRRLVVTTNKSLDKLPGDLENRIGSRLRRNGEVVTIDDIGEYTDRKGK